MATRYWVGGSGTWDASDTTHWAAASNGAGGQSVPTSADNANIDLNSGSGGTVTINGNHTVFSFNGGGFPGTIDWSVNNNDFTSLGGFAFNDFSGTVATVKLGSGTFYLDTISVIQGSALAWVPGTALLQFGNRGNPTTSLGIALISSFPVTNVQVGPDASWPLHTFSNSPVITNLTLAGPVKVRGNITITVTNLTGTASAKGKGVETRGEPTQTWAVTNPATLHWSVLRGVTFSVAAARAYNSMNGGSCVNVQISPPKYGRIIGG
jgi:hypothetical protein